MKFKKLLYNLLQNKLEEEKLKLLPKGFQRIGDVVILRLNKKLYPYASLIGNFILQKYKARTVCLLEEIKGKIKKPKIKVIAGKKSTEVIFQENFCKFKLDVKKIMWAKGNVKERGRISHLVRKNEIVVDMFAGIGYFTIPIAKFSSPKKVIAIDINPLAIHYLRENLKLNNIKEKVFPLVGDSRKISNFLKIKADRVILGLIPNDVEFLNQSFKILKKRGIIHYHDTFKEEELPEKPIKILQEIARKNGFKLEKVLYFNKVKKYAPRIFHVVVDGKFVKK